VPKIMAAAIIGKHPERYGFTEVDYQPELVYDTVHVDGSVELEVIAKCADVAVDDLKWLNPALRRYATPPEGYDVRIPVGRKETFVAALDKVPKDQRLTVVRHTVRRGETLSTIASRYGTSVSAVSSANGLKNVNRIYVGMTLVIPRHGSAPVAVASSSRSSGASSSSSSRPTVHTVRRGDTLSGIAGRYGLTVSQLKAYNGLSSSTIMAGQKLKLTGSGGATSGGAGVTHVVQRGESLSAIASRYGTTASAIQRANGIQNASHIVVGQRLKVSPGSGSGSSWTTYTVRSGDSLGKIASRYGCSVQELQSWNGIRGSTIHPGQQIKIRRG
jgi:membrane-bound lytic murein transglycosylase D